MALLEEITSSLSLINNTNMIPDQTYKKLLEIALQDLLQSKTSDVKLLYGAKADVIKEVHATVMKTFLILARNNTTKDKALNLLTKQCKIETNRCKLFVEEYEKHRLQLLLKLGNIGTHLPHIVDVDWEIDFVIKSSALDASQGPLYKVKLVTEKFDVINQSNKLEDVVFWCTAQELQDLVYTLEDTVRHCQKIASGH